MTARILVGDCREKLRELPDESVHVCVTSPPYMGLRDYGADGQIGLEGSLAAFLDALVGVFREVRRILHPTGLLFVNMGDSYHTDSPVRTKSAEAFSETWDKSQTASRGGLRKSAAKSGPFKNKDLMLVPARLAIALVDDGWWLRAENVWAKPNPMPESVRDRTTRSHEFVYMFAKRPKYFYDAEAVAETALQPDGTPALTAQHKRGVLQNLAASTLGSNQGASTRNLRSVWTITPEPYAGSHFATFPRELPRRCIKAGTSERGCCPACLSPWRRLREPTPEYREILAKANDRGDWYPRVTTTGKREDGTKHGKLEGGIRPDYVTTGWEPTCACPPHEPIPCTVLDPFAGAGTTGLVADELGRDAILIELNDQYAQMARDRIYGAAPLFAAVEVA